MWREFTTDYNPDPVLNGLTLINLFYDVDKIRDRWPGILADPLNTAKYQPLATDNKDFEMTENYYAGYVMMKFNALNELITFVPGFRYEGDDFNALGHLQYVVTSSTENFSGLYEERIAKRKHGFFLPMMHLKIKPADWFDVRLAATKTISRPNSLYLVPFVSVSYINSTVTVGNPDLKTTESWNYDLSFSMYDGKIGLITVSGFYKELKNFSYRGKFFLDSLAIAVNNGYNPFEPQLQSAIVNTVNKNLDIPINTPGISTVRGFEIDYQANFLSLPGFLKNLVFNVNYTRIWSKSQLRNYRVKEKKAGIDANGDYYEKLIYDPNPTRGGPLQTQPDHILNASLGIDVGGFSGRVSAFYQGRNLSGVGDTELGDSYVSGYLRYDMSMRYRLNENISLLLNGVNLTSTPDISTLSGTDKHSSYAVYGTMFDFGVQVGF
jgi:TonB-dependent receptor